MVLRVRGTEAGYGATRARELRGAFAGDRQRFWAAASRQRGIYTDDSELARVGSYARATPCPVLRTLCCYQVEVSTAPAALISRVT
eukprot:3104700-Rhodomonas_salina.3